MQVKIRKIGEGLHPNEIVVQVKTDKGEEALVVAAEFHPEVAFLDIGLPGINGYELARLLRANSLHSPIFLVAVSGWGSDEDKRKAHVAGFDAHLTKPADVQRVISILENLTAAADSDVS